MDRIPGPDTFPPARRGMSACYAVRGATRPLASDCFGLPTAAAQALAEVLPVLICGEVSAETVFTSAGEMFTRRGEAALGEALASIANDELRHAQWLAYLRAGLPSPRASGAARAVTRFLRGLHTHELATHLARVAALDAAVCLVLARACARTAPLAAHPVPFGIFNRIRKDEGRHVRISRRCANALGLPAGAAAQAQREVHAQFAELLLPWGDSLETLGISLARLHQRLARSGPALDGDARQ